MLKKIFFFIAVIWTSVVLTLCLIKFGNMPSTLTKFEHTDKVVHTVFHLVLTTAWFLFFRMHFLKNKKYNPFVIAFLFSVVLGIVIEFLQQYFTATRCGDLLDIVANVFGSLLGLLFCQFINYKFFKPNVTI